MSTIKKTANRSPSFDVDDESHNLANSNEDNSFAVYLSGLKPDPVPEYAKEQITKYANIIDKSGDIDFADGWDND